VKVWVKSSKIQWSDVKIREGKGSKLWWGCEGCVSVVKWNEGKVMVKYEYISPLHKVFHYCYTLGYSVLVLIFSVTNNLLNYGCKCICCSRNRICIVFIVRSVLYCFCSFVCCVLFECGVSFCVMCVICV
jgi:hypothetical protein